MTNTQETYPNLTPEQLARADALTIARQVILNSVGIFGGNIADRHEGELILLADYIIGLPVLPEMPEDVELTSDDAVPVATDGEPVVTGIEGFVSPAESMSQPIAEPIRARTSFTGGGGI